MSDSLLIVDDDQSFLYAASNALSASGFSVDTAETYEDAVGKISINRYCAVISDISLSGPGSSQGLDILSLVKKNYDGVKVIMITGWGDSLTERTAYGHEADFYFQKPVSPRVLVGSLKYMGIVPCSTESNMSAR